MENVARLGTLLTPSFLHSFCFHPVNKHECSSNCVSDTGLHRTLSRFLLLFIFKLSTPIFVRDCYCFQITRRHTYIMIGLAECLAGEEKKKKTKPQDHCFTLWRRRNPDVREQPGQLGPAAASPPAGASKEGQEARPRCSLLLLFPPLLFTEAT